MSTSLNVMMHGRRVAVLTRDSRSGHRLDYDPDLGDVPLALPVSLSLPLTRRTHRGSAVTNFIDNLLPDNPLVRERWAQRAGLANADLFDLLTHYGQDVAGAVWFRGDGDESGGQRSTLSEGGIASRIRTARDDATSWHDDERPAEGQFSLGGAQVKFSLAWHRSRWFETAGSEPSTHIFKPAVQGVPDGEIVEFITMRAAACLGIPAARVELLSFGGEHSLVVERFDRAQGTHPVIRFHQEDLAQALGIPRLRKYEEHGGPSIDASAEFLKLHTQVEDDSRRRFAQVLAFSWIMLNTDSHAKNHSVFIDGDGARLTPLYDASSVIPYLGPDDLDDDSVRARARSRTLAMRYGASFSADDVGAVELGAIARRCGIETEEFLIDVRAYCIALPGVVRQIAAELPVTLRTEVVERFVRWMPLRAEQAFEAVRARA